MNVLSYFLIFSAIVVAVSVGGALCETVELSRIAVPDALKRAADMVCRLLMTPPAFVYVCAVLICRDEFSFFAARRFTKEFFVTSGTSEGVSGGRRDRF